MKGAIYSRFGTDRQNESSSRRSGACAADSRWRLLAHWNDNATALRTHTGTWGSGASCRLDFLNFPGTEDITVRSGRAPR